MGRIEYSWMTLFPVGNLRWYDPLQWVEIRMDWHSRLRVEYVAEVQGYSQYWQRQRWDHVSKSSRLGLMKLCRALTTNYSTGFQHGEQQPDRKEICSETRVAEGHREFQHFLTLRSSEQCRPTDVPSCYD